MLPDPRGRGWLFHVFNLLVLLDSDHHLVVLVLRTQVSAKSQIIAVSASFEEFLIVDSLSEVLKVNVFGQVVFIG